MSHRARCTPLALIQHDSSVANRAEAPPAQISELYKYPVAVLARPRVASKAGRESIVR
jgi:hypothetical protein